MEVNETKRMKELERENSELKKMVPQWLLENLVFGCFPRAPSRLKPPLPGGGAAS